MGSKRNAWRAVAVLLSVLLFAACGGGGPATAPGQASVEETPGVTPIATRSATIQPTAETQPASGGPAAAASALLDGHTGEAVARYTGLAATAVGVQRTSALMGLARALDVSGEPGEAEAAMRAAVAESGPASGEGLSARFGLAHRLSRAGRFSESAALLSPFLSAPASALRPYALAELGDALVRSGAAGASTEPWDALLATPALPASLGARGWRGRAAVAWEAGDTAGYFDASARSLSLVENPGLRLERGRRFLDSGSGGAGIAEFQAVLVSAPASGNALGALRELQKLNVAVAAGQAALVLYRAGQNAEAVRVVDQAGEGLSGTEGAMAAYYGAAALEELGEDARAVQLYDRAGGLAPGSVYAHQARYWSARILEAKGERAAAAVRYADVSGDAGGEFAAEGAFRAGYMAYLDGRTEEAATTWERLPGVGGARNWYWVGKVKAAAGEPLAARAAWVAAAAGAGSEFYARLAKSRLDGADWPGAVPFREADLGGPDWLALQVASGPPSAAGEAAALSVRLLADAGATALALTTAREACSGSTVADAVAVSAAAWDAGLTSAAIRCWQEVTLPTGAALATARWGYPVRYVASLTEVARSANLDPLLIAALVRQESLWQADVGSSAGALGLTQVIPETANDVASRLGRPSVRDEQLGDPELNLTLGVRYLFEQLRSFQSVAIALAAYNAGPGNAARWATADMDPAAYLERITFGETRAYVEGVLAQYARYTAVYRPN